MYIGRRTRGITSHHIIIERLFLLQLAARIDYFYMERKGKDI